MKKLQKKLNEFAKKYDTAAMVRSKLVKVSISRDGVNDKVCIYDIDNNRYISKGVKITDEIFPISIIAIRRRRGKKLLKSEDIIILRPLDILYAV